MTDELPPGWATTSVGEIIEARNGRAFKSTEWRKSGLPIIRIQNLKDDAASFNYFDGQLEEKHLVRSGDLLFAWSGTPGTSFGAHVWKGPDAALNQHIFRLDFNRTAFNTDFLRHALNQNVALYIEQAQGGVGLAHITKAKFDASLLRIPPKNEQNRIVDRLDELFSRIDEGERALERVSMLVERYRQSVLKAAVTGELTRAWREKNKDTLESGQALLARILTARREAWEKAELEKMKAKGITPANDKWKQKYVEPSPPEAAGLPELPLGWAWATVEQLSSDVAYGTSAKCNNDPSGVPVVRMGNIVAGQLDLSDLKYLPSNHDEFPSLLLRAGDLLFNRTNSAELVGKSAVYTSRGGECSFASYLIRVRSVVVNAEWLAHYINSAFGRAWVASVKNEQVGQANVNGSKLKALAVPLPPELEISAALDLIAREFGRVRSAAKSIEVEILRVNALRQAVLRAAFAGHLVSQDPADEPAATLLQGIAARRGANTAAPTRGRKKKTTA